MIFLKNQKSKMFWYFVLLKITWEFKIFKKFYFQLYDSWFILHFGYFLMLNKSLIWNMFKKYRDGSYIY